MTPPNHTSTEDFYNTLEPLPDQPQDQMAEVLGKLFDSMFSAKKHVNPDTPEVLRLRLEAAFRRFAATVWIIRPQAIAVEGVRSWRMAEALGITRAGFSKVAVEVSDSLGGLRNGLMKSRESRETLSAAGGKTRCGGIAKRKPVHIGEAGCKNDGRMQVQEEIVTRALEKLRTSEAEQREQVLQALDDGLPVPKFSPVTWSAAERHALIEGGVITEDGTLTEAGRLRVEGVGGPGNP